MSLPEQLAALSEPSAYPHECDAICVSETHISWVILTGPFAYKLKKPVRFPFVDFSTLERREHFCHEELRCNRRFAPSLYLDVVPVGRRSDGRLVVDESGDVVEWAVKMRQFDPDAQLDRMLARGELTLDMLRTFGRTLAEQHRSLPVGEFEPFELEARVIAPVRDNYDDLEGLEWAADELPLLARGRSAMKQQVEALRPLLLRRFAGGWIRECHGDLHLSNLVALTSGVTAFDCLEFDPHLRWIDPMSDVAFLLMDCLVRDRADLAYGFLDGYLDASGDYEGAIQLAFYSAYRSMVRAKVAALRRKQAPGEERRELEQRFVRHVAWASRWLERPAGHLVLMCGLSGSGKSWLAERLVPQLPGVRLRSDVARKARAGLAPEDPAAEGVGTGLYDPRHTEDTYAWLAGVTGRLLRTGEHVMVDATFLRVDQRAPFMAMAARLGAPAVILHCDAPPDVLKARISSRAAAGGDPSDADPAVLEQQMSRFEPPEKGAIVVDTRRLEAPAHFTELAGRLLAER